MYLDSLFERSLALFGEQFTGRPALVAAAPGRANIIGEHTDYNDGHVLPIAIDRFVAAAVRKRGDGRYRLHSANLGESFSFDVESLPAALPQWASYIVGVVAELAVCGVPSTGQDMLVVGEVPLGSGLSSSAALEVAVATALERSEGLTLSDVDLAAACRRAEHRYAGTLCGPMDQVAARACRAQHAMLLDCRSLAVSHLPLPPGLGFLSVYSGIPRSLAASGYNERLECCRGAVVRLREAGMEIQALRDLRLEELAVNRTVLGDRIFRRVRHVVTEQERVREMTIRLDTGDIDAVGHLLLAGHLSLSQDYEVSLPILDRMVEWLIAQPGVIGARLTGAGFGGSLIVAGKIRDMDVPALEQRMIGAFARHTPEPPAVWQLRAVDGANRIPSRVP